MNFILWTLLVSIGINLVMFIPAYIFQTDKLTDISYALTFIVVAIAGFMRSSQNALHKFVLVLVLVWAFRLGTFLFIRINKMKRDVRFDGMRDKFFAFLRFWLLQGATVFVVLLAVSYCFMQNTAPVTYITALGVLLFFKGLIIEAIADAQKFRFSHDSKNKGKWIDVGVWRVSRHPNYLGEMMVWVGLYLAVLPSLSSHHIVWALVSPLYIITLLLFVSGVPLLEKSAEKKWETDPDYKAYKKEVPVVLPTFLSITRLFEK